MQRNLRLSFVNDVLAQVEESLQYGQSVLDEHNCTTFELRIDAARIGTNKNEVTWICVVTRAYR